MGKGKGYLTWFLQANPLLPLTEWGAIQLECLLFIFQGCSLQLHGPLSEGPTWKGSPKRSWKNGWNILGGEFWSPSYLEHGVEHRKGYCVGSGGHRPFGLNDFVPYSKKYG